MIIKGLMARFIISFFLISSCFFTACIDTQKITFFENQPDSSWMQLNTIALPNSIIQPNDMLEIRIGGESEQTVQYITQYFGTPAGIPLDCLVDASGHIELPRLGKLFVSGMKRDSAAEMIRSRYAEFLINPVVSMRYMNFRFAVFGEVKNPGYFTIPNEKINLFEALSQAGGITQYSRLDNIKLIKDVNGNRTIISLNFNDQSILNTPYFYLDRYDMLYVAPSENKANSDNLARSLPIITASISVLAIIISLFR